MLKTLWNSVRPPRGPDEKDGSDRRTGIDAAKLKILTEFFPIGRKLRYYPEFQQDIVFDTLIVAYCVNERFIYSRDAIEMDGNGNPATFMIGEERSALPLSRVKQFHLLVPDTSEMEKTLDYHRRAIIGRARQFLKGNAITLMANAGARGVSTVDTQVARQIAIKEGPYTNSKMILLDPAFDTLSVSDQRRKARVKTRVPVDLYLNRDEPPFSCVLGDFSESSMRLRVGENLHAMPALAEGFAVTIAIDLGEAAKTYWIKGWVLRRATDSCVIQFEELYKDGEFLRFNLMDTLELKTGLLNYGN